MGGAGVGGDGVGGGGDGVGGAGVTTDFVTVTSQPTFCVLTANPTRVIRLSPAVTTYSSFDVTTECIGPFVTYTLEAMGPGPLYAAVAMPAVQHAVVPPVPIMRTLRCVRKLYLVT